jgi:hypothetical protein
MVARWPHHEHGFTAGVVDVGDDRASASGTTGALQKL